MYRVLFAEGNMGEAIRAAKLSIRILDGRGVTLRSPGWVNVAATSNAIGDAWGQEMDTEIIGESDLVSPEDRKMQMDMVRRAQDTWREQRQEVLEEGERAVADTVGAWAAFRLALRGHLRLDKRNKSYSGNKAAMTECAFCAANKQVNEENAQQSTLLQCSRCKAVAYCCREHQKQHWSEHKIVCEQLRVERVAVAEAQAESNVPLPQRTKTDVKSIVTACLGLINSYMDRRDSTRRGHKNIGKHQWVSSPKLVLGVALLVASAVETLADIAEQMQQSFRPMLMAVYFPLLALSIDPNPVVQMAAQTSLSRLGLYLEYESTQEMLRANLDYITDSVCSVLRQAVLDDRRRHKPHSRNEDQVGQEEENESEVRFDARIPAVVEFIMATLSDSTSKESVGDAEKTQEANLLQDMVINVLDSIDAFAACGTLSLPEIGSLLKVMQVIVNRTTIPFAQDHPDAKSDTTIDFPGSAAPAKNWGAKESLSEFVCNLRTMRAAERDGPSHTPIADLDGNECEQDMQETDEEKLLEAVKNSAQYSLLVEIANRCSYFISSQHSFSLETSLLIVQSVLLKLRRFRHALLPLIHKIWPSVVNRLRDLRVLLYSTSTGTATAATVTSGRPAASLLAREESSYIRGPLSSGLFGSTEVSTLFSEKHSVYRIGDASDQVTKGKGVNVFEGPDSSSKLNLSRRALFSLPSLMKLLTLLADLGGDFMTTKFNESFWPEINKMLICLCSQELNVYARGRNQLPATATPQGASTASSRRSVDTVCKESILDCLLHLADGSVGGEVHSYMIRAAPATAFMLLPLLHTSQALQVRERGVELLRALMRLDPAWLCTLLSAVSRSGSEAAWMAIMCDPRLDAVITASLELKGGRASSSRTSASKALFRNLLESLRADDVLMHSTGVVLSQHVASVAADAAAAGSVRGGAGEVEAILSIDSKWLHNIHTWART